jgi:uncharacterized membrane protein
MAASGYAAGARNAAAGAREKAASGANALAGAAAGAPAAIAGGSAAAGGGIASETGDDFWAKSGSRAFGAARHFAIILLAALVLFAGYRIATADFVNANERYGHVPAAEAKVTGIISERVFAGVLYVTFGADVIRGIGDGRLTATQARQSDGNKMVEVGDKVVVSRSWDPVKKQANGFEPFSFVAYLRTDKIMLFGGAFVALLILFCRKKGLNALLSLGMTLAAIVAFFIPSLLSGKNIYASAVAVCVFSILATLLIVYGINEKSFAAAAGCFGGVIFAGAITLGMNRALGITGILNFNSRQLLVVYSETPIDLKAIVFASIIIGAVGAIMDASMSISSSLWELKAKAPGLTFGGIFQSGVNIGRDLLGTMADTLVLAYVGNSLPFVLVHIVYSRSFVEFANKEIVIVELLNIITGSFGVLLSMPFTALVCAMLYSRRRRAPASGQLEISGRAPAVGG